MSESVDYRVPAIEARRVGWSEVTIEEAARAIRSHTWVEVTGGLRCIACQALPSSALIYCTDSAEVQAQRRKTLERNVAESEWTWAKSKNPK